MIRCDKVEDRMRETGLPVMCRYSFRSVEEAAQSRDLLLMVGVCFTGFERMFVGIDGALYPFVVAFDD